MLLRISLIRQFPCRTTGGTTAMKSSPTMVANSRPSRKRCSTISCAWSMSATWLWNCILEKKMYISTTSIPDIFWANKPLPPRCLHEFYGICIHPKLQSCNCGACHQEEEGECFEVSGLSESTLHDTHFDPCPADVQTKFELTPPRL